MCFGFSLHICKDRGCSAFLTGENCFLHFCHLGKQPRCNGSGRVTRHTKCTHRDATFGPVGSICWVHGNHASSQATNHATRAERLQVVEHFLRIGLTRAAFSRQYGIPLATLNWWLAKPRRASNLPARVVFSKAMLSRAPSANLQSKRFQGYPNVAANSWLEAGL